MSRNAANFLAISAALASLGGDGYGSPPARRGKAGHGLSDREWKRRKARRRMQRESRRRNRS